MPYDITALPNEVATGSPFLGAQGFFINAYRQNKTLAEDFLKRDPYEIFQELRAKVDPTLCQSALAGIVGASRGVRWHLVSRESAEDKMRDAVAGYLASMDVPLPPRMIITEVQEMGRE